VILQVQSLAEMGAPVKKTLSRTLLDTAGSEPAQGSAEADSP